MIFQHGTGNGGGGDRQDGVFSNITVTGAYRATPDGAISTRIYYTDENLTYQYQDIRNTTVTIKVLNGLVVVTSSNRSDLVNYLQSSGDIEEVVNTLRYDSYDRGVIGGWVYNVYGDCSVVDTSWD